MEKKILNKKNIPVLRTLAIVIMGGLLLKVIADRQSRVDF
jgi:hypothetical protein